MLRSLSNTWEVSYFCLAHNNPITAPTELNNWELVSLFFGETKWEQRLMPSPVKSGDGSSAKWAMISKDVECYPSEWRNGHRLHSEVRDWTSHPQLRCGWRLKRGPECGVIFFLAPWTLPLFSRMYQAKTIALASCSRTSQTLRLARRKAGP